MIARLQGWLRRRRAERYLDRLIDNHASGRTINMAFADLALATETGPWIDWLRRDGYRRHFGVAPGDTT